MIKPAAQFVLRHAKARGITVSELATTLGMQQPQLSRYLHGSTVPRPERLAALASALRLDPGDERMMRIAFDLNQVSNETLEWIIALEAAGGTGDICDDRLHRARSYIDGLLSARLSPPPPSLLTGGDGDDSSAARRAVAVARPKPS